MARHKLSSQKAALHLKSNEQGGALSMVLIILMVVIILGSAILQASSSNYAFGITDHKQQSSYYIAEAGARFAITELQKQATLLKGEATATSFYTKLGNTSIVKSVTNQGGFSPQFGVTPQAVISVAFVRQETPLIQVYKVTSKGIIGNNTKTVSAEFRVSFPNNTALDQFIKEVFISASAADLKNTSGLDAGSGLLWIKGDVNATDFNGGSFNKIKKVMVEGNLDIGQGIDMGTGGANSWFAVKGDATISGNPKFLSELYVYKNMTIPSGSPTFNQNVFVGKNFTIGTMAAGARTGGNPTFVKNVTFTGTYFPTNVSFTGILGPLPKTEVPFVGYDFALREKAWYEDTSRGYKTKVSELSLGVVDSGIQTYRLKDDGKYAFTDSPGVPIVFKTNYNDSDPKPMGNGSYDMKKFVIVSKGNVTLDYFSQDLSGVIITEGNITMKAKSFTGILISKGKVTVSGYPPLIMKSLRDYFTTNDQIPITFNASGGGALLDEPQVDLITPIK